MGIRIYPLPSGDEDGSKFVYPLGLRMGMEMNFYYGDGDPIMIPVPVLPCCHSYVACCLKCCFDACECVNINCMLFLARFKICMRK